MTEGPDEEEVRAAINDFLRRELPQIQMHGGESAIVALDLDEKSVTIQLSGACSGCGISPMTIQAIRRRLPQHIDVIDTVHAETGMEEDSRTQSDDNDDSGVQAPF